MRALVLLGAFCFYPIPLQYYHKPLRIGYTKGYTLSLPVILSHSTNINTSTYILLLLSQ